jgi:signal transduction histidine kinase
VYLCRVRKFEGTPDGAGANLPWSRLTSQLIIDIATAAAGERDLDQILHETLDRLRIAMPLTGGSIALVQGDELVIRAAVGPFAEEALGQRSRRGPGLSWRVVETLESSLLPDMRASEAVIRGPKARQAIRSWLAVPIVRRGRGIGLLEIDSIQPNAFSPADMELLETIVRVLSGPVELADHYAAEQRANQLRDAFIGVISHELRTPITTIYGLSKMLRQRGADLDPDVIVSTIEDVEAEADRLQRLVEDLLVLSRAERGAMDIEGEPLGMARILRRVVEAEQARLPGRTIELRESEGLPIVIGEETYVEQVVRNLLTNAAKYADTATPIVVVVEAVDQEVVTRVFDEGIGIAEDDAERVFELFFRSTSATRMAGGAGIGLFVCRQLVEAMGGRIWAAPRSPAGAEVGFALPAHREDETSP